jgi:hypothetical protein
VSKVVANVTEHLTRSYLLGRSSGDAVAQEREEVASMLIMQGLVNAAHALRHKPRSFQEFFEIRRVILSGGPRLMRLKNGRAIES